MRKHIQRFLIVLTVQATLAPAANCDLVAQAKIQETLENILVSSEDKAPEDRIGAINAIAEQLLAGTHLERQTFLEQLIYFSTNNDAFESDNETPFAVGLLVDHAGFSQTEILDVVAPLWLEANVLMKKSLGEWVQVAVESGDASSFDNFLPYMRHSFATSKKLPDGLVAYLYERSPKRALTTMGRFFGADPEGLKTLLNETQTLPSSHFGVVTGRNFGEFSPVQVDCLKRLSTSPHWWVRMFALEVASLSNSSHARELLGSLANDEHDLIRRVATLDLQKKLEN